MTRPNLSSLHEHGGPGMVATRSANNQAALAGRAEGTGEGKNARERQNGTRRGRTE